MNNPHFEYNANGNLIKEKWLRNGELHREDGPALTVYYADGSIEKLEMYCINGQKHRINGPGTIRYCKDGHKDISFNYNGASYTREANRWIHSNEVSSWKKLTEEDYNRMWEEIL